MKTAFIYGLKDPTADLIRYVGKTNNPQRRSIQHYWERRNPTNKGEWIKSLKRKGLKPEIIIIDKVNDNEWVDAEKGYIKLFKSFGANLLNMTEGGEGGVTEETAKKISKARKGRFYGKNSHRAKTVFQYTLDGIFIKKWDSTNIASKALNIHRSEISRNCNKKNINSAGGYVWSYKKEKNIKYYNSTRKPVCQINNIGEVIGEWKSIRETERETKHCRRHISIACRENKLYVGFYWKFKNEA